jgi:hypothetical protein
VPFAHTHRHPNPHTRRPPSPHAHTHTRAHTQAMTQLPRPGSEWSHHGHRGSTLSQSHITTPFHPPSLARAWRLCGSQTPCPASNARVWRVPQPDLLGTQKLFDLLLYVLGVHGRWAAGDVASERFFLAPSDSGHRLTANPRWPHTHTHTHKPHCQCLSHMATRDATLTTAIEYEVAVSMFNRAARG